MKKSTWIIIADFVLNAVIVLVLAFGIRTYIVSPFRVFGPSMCNTLNYIDDKCSDGYGDLMLVNEFVYQDFFGFKVSAPAVGDVIIFRPPERRDQFYVKRIIGVPGDRIKIEGGYVYKWSDGGYVLLDESSYLSDENYGQTFLARTEQSAEYVVPEDSYFVMGDNRNRSTDSRRCFITSFGGTCTPDSPDVFITTKDIRGKAWIVLWPLQNTSMIKNPFKS